VPPASAPILPLPNVTLILFLHELVELRHWVPKERRDAPEPGELLARCMQIGEDVDCRASRLRGLDEGHVLCTPLYVLRAEEGVGEQQTVNGALLGGVAHVARRSESLSG
jgi:hypothetical protein